MYLYLSMLVFLSIFIDNAAISKPVNSPHPVIILKSVDLYHGLRTTEDIYDLPTPTNFPDFPYIVELFSTDNINFLADNIIKDKRLYASECAWGFKGDDLKNCFYIGVDSRDSMNSKDIDFNLYIDNKSIAQELFDTMSINPYGIDCYNSCKSYYIKELYNIDNIDYETKLDMARSLWYDFPTNTHSAFFYYPVLSSEEKRLIIILKKLISLKDPLDCGDIEHDFELVIDACGVFRYGIYNKINYIVYCRRTNVPEIGPLIERCVPLARIIRGQWHLVSRLATAIRAAGGSSSYVCRFTKIRNWNNMPSVLSRLVGTALFGTPIKFRWRHDSSFVIGGSRLNVDLAKWDEGLRGWGAIQFAGGISGNSDGSYASMTFSIDILASNRRITSRTEAKEVEPVEYSRIRDAAIGRIHATFVVKSKGFFDGGCERIDPF